MNIEKLNEYLELCDKIIESEKKEIVHRFDWEHMDDDLAVVDSHVIADTLKYYGILCADFTEGPPPEWMSAVWGSAWEETYSQFRDTEEHDKLLAKFEQMIETIKDVAISHNIEATRDLKDWEDTARSLRYIYMSSTIHQSIIEHLGVDVDKWAGLQIDNAHTGSPEYYVTDLITGEESKYITYNGAYLAMASIVRKHKTKR